MNEIISHAGMGGDEDAKVLEQDGEFGDVDQGGIKSFFSVDCLNLCSIFILDCRW